MKKIIIFVTLLGGVFAMSSCGSVKRTAAPNDYYVAPRPQSNNSNPDGQEIRLSDAEEYALLAPGKRAAGKGVSSNESSATQLAELEARRAFSDAIASAIVSAAKRSGFEITNTSSGETESESATDGGEKQNTLAKSVSQEIVSSAVVVKKSKFYNSENKRFTIYVCLEYNGTVADIAKKAVQQVKQRVSDEERIKIDYNLKKYEDEVVKDLEKMQ